MHKLKFFIQESWLLIVAAFGFGLVLAATNAAWAPKIEANRIEKFNGKVRTLFTAENIEATPLDEMLIFTSSKGKESNVEVKKVEQDGELLGWAFACKGSGFADKIEIVLAIDADFTSLKGFGVLSSNETPGFGDKIKYEFYQSQFRGAPTSKLVLSKIGDDKTIDDTIVAITGATVSSEAVVKIVNDYIAQVKSQLEAKGLIGNGK